jgi:hypothetical protein
MPVCESRHTADGKERHIACLKGDLLIRMRLARPKGGWLTRKASEKRSVSPPLLLRIAVFC